MRQLPRNLAIAFAAGILLLVSVLGALDLFTAFIGFPLPFSHPIAGCFGPGSPLGCSTYDPLAVVLDYLFWVGVTFLIIMFIVRVATRVKGGPC